MSVTDKSAAGQFPSGGGIFGFGFPSDPDPLGAILTIMPNANDGTTPIDRSGAAGGEKTITAVNGAVITDAPKRYGSGALLLKRATKQHAAITPFADFAFGTGVFGVGGNYHPTLDGVRQTLFSTGSAPGALQIARTAANTVEVRIKGGSSTAPTPTVYNYVQPASPVHRYVNATSGADSNTGATPDLAWRTLSKALQSATAGMIVHFADGNYTGSLQQTTDGTAANPITFVSDNKWGAKIIPPASSSRQEALDIRGDYVQLVGFEINGLNPQSGTHWTFGIYAGGTTCRVYNCKIHDIAWTDSAWAQATSGNGGAGMQLDSFYGGQNHEAHENWVYNIGRATTTSSLIHGVYLSAPNSKAINNVIYTISGDGITSWHDATNLRIINNTIWAARSAGVLVGWGGPYIGTTQNANTEVRNNIIRGCAKGIEQFGTVVTPVYSHNCLYQNSTQTQGLTGSNTNGVTSDPLMVSFVTGGTGDYHLQASSPCRGTATSTNAPARDFDGYARPQNGTYDMGAYEYVAPGVAGDDVYTTSQVMPGNQHTHVWVSRDAGNTLTIRLEGKTYLSQAGVTKAIVAEQALIGIDTPTGSDGFDGTVDGFWAAKGNAIFNADFGPGVGAPPPVTGTRRLVFQENFDTFDPMSGSDVWSTRLPWGGPNGGTDPYDAAQHQQYVNVQAGDTKGPNPFSVANSVLTIKATPTSGLTGGKTYTSGVITTQGRFATAFGYFEMRAKMPGGNGFWPQFWLAPDALESELPSMTVLSYASKFPTQYRLDAVWGGGSIEAEAAGANHLASLANLSADYHIFGFEWTPSALVWYLDDREVYRRTVPAASDFDVPHFLIVNLAVGDAGGWQGAPDGTQQSLQIDWIKVWDSRTGSPAVYYVGPDGSDAYTGTMPTASGGDGPFATLEKARDQMRATGTKRVIIRGGFYRLTNPLVLSSLDSGTSWEAYPGETPVIHGAEKLSTWTNEGSGLYSKTTVANGLDVFIGTERQRAAQSGVYNPADPYQSGWFIAPADGTTTTIRYTAGQFGSEVMDDGCYVQAFDRERLKDEIQLVSTVDAGSTTITTDGAMQYAIRAGGTFRFVNRAAYIRNAGEFGYRVSDGKLVLRPKTTSFDTDGVYVARLGRLLTMTGTQNTQWKGLHFRYATFSEQSVRLEVGANGNVFDGCVFNGVGTGVQINASNNNIVRNCTFQQIGAWGVYLENGATNNAVEKNSFTDVSQIRKEMGAVGGNGVHKTSVRYNDINGSARYGVSFKDWAANNAHTENAVEFNYIRNIGRETADCAAVESLGRSNGDTKLTVIGNWIEEVRGLATDASGRWLTDYKAFGVYLDDQTNGANVYRNLITGCSWACLFVHGGDNNRLESNICILGKEAEHAIRLEHQPLAGTIGTLSNNYIRGNIVYAAVAVTDYMQLVTPGTYTKERNLVYRVPALTNDLIADPQFVDAATGNWRLKSVSPALTMPGFVEPPWDLMGIDGVPLAREGSGGGTPSTYPTTKGGFLVSGNQILDGDMKPVRFTGCNWNGAEWDDGSGNNLIPAGLTSRSYRSIMDQMKSLGFNLIRIPHADTTIVSTSTNHSWATNQNPDFAGKRKIDILGLICRYARQIGMYVLLDHHRNNANTGSGTQVNFLAGDGFTLQNIIDNWKTLVTHPDIFGNPAVLGCDIHNEPNGRNFNWSIWAPQAEQIANAIHSVNPNVLAVIEGNEISFFGGGEDWTWWGGNFEDFQTRPLVINRMDKLCLSVHEYGPYLVGTMKSWMASSQFPNNMFGTSGIWDKFWGYLWRQKKHPFIVGEFGAKFEDPSLTKEVQWIEALHKYMNGDIDNTGQLYLSAGEVGISWTMWTYTPYSGDTGGIMLNDFQTVAQNRYSKYQPHLWSGAITPPPQIRLDGTRI